MLSLSERFRHRDSVVFVATDTIDPLIEHVLGIFGEGREMTKLQRYRTNSTDTDRTDRGFNSTTITTGLTLANPDDYAVKVIDRWEQTNPPGKGLRVILHPGTLEGFGFSAHEHEALTEEAVRARYWAKDLRNITVVRTDGWPGSPTREDRIEIETWNEHGVCSDVVIAFNR